MVCCPQSMMAQLQQLFLSSTSISGALPAEWSGLTELQQLDLSATFISGSLPAQWSAMAKLQSLSLRGSGGSDGQPLRISGTLPPEWALLTNLGTLGLSITTLSGMIHCLHSGGIC